MKKIIFLFLLISSASAWSQSKLDPKKIIGKWVVTWAWFSSTSTPKSEGSAPLLEAIWTFNSNGTYSIQASMNETGTYSIKDSVLITDADKPISPEFDKREYKITTLNNDKLEIGYDITRTASFFMVSYSAFKRKK